MDKRALVTSVTVLLVVAIGAAVVVLRSTVATGPVKQESFDDVKAAAERGDAAAQYKLGVALQTGTRKSDIEGATWIRKSAEQGLADAQYKLGVMLVSGRVIPKNEVEAVS